MLASGGLDSSVMLVRIAQKRREVFPLYIRTGLLWEKDEIAVLRRFIEAVGIKSIRPLTVLNVPMEDVAAGHWSMTGKKVPGYRAALSSNYIPGRNLTLLSKAAVFCAGNRIGELAMALLEANPFPRRASRVLRGDVKCGEYRGWAAPQNFNSMGGQVQGGSDRAGTRLAAAIVGVMYQTARRHPLRSMHQVRRTDRGLPSCGHPGSDTLPQTRRLTRPVYRPESLCHSRSGCVDSKISACAGVP